MGIMDYFRDRKKKNLPLIARVDLTALQKEMEKNMQLGEVSILARADYTKRIPTIRLYYVAMEKFTRYGTGESKIGQTFGISSPFRIPRGMSIEDACKIVSYLSEKVEKENNLEPASEKSVAMVSNLLSSYGFDKVESKAIGHFHIVSDFVPFHRVRTDSFAEGKKIDGVVDLFSVGGDFKVFNRSDLRERYFDWFTPKVSKEDVTDMYKNYRIDYLLPSDHVGDDDHSL